MMFGLKFWPEKIGLLGLGLAAGLILGNYFFLRSPHESRELVGSQSLRESAHGFRFINPLLACELSEKIQLKELAPLTAKMKDWEQKAKKEGLIKEASVYVRILNNGRWAYLNQELKYSPASLMKLPIMMAILKYAEFDPDILKKKMRYQSGEPDENQREHEKPAVALTPGQSYSVEELIYRLIIYSDNNTVRLLLTAIDERSLTEIFNDLSFNLPSQEAQSNQDYLDTKSFGLFFRILYNASYLSRSSSDYTLELLSLSDYQKGLKRELPANLTVAHKFGERTIWSADQNPVKELHDCGIVYYPANPYLICVMTKGEEWGNLENFIAVISRLVYKEIEKL